MQLHARLRPFSRLALLVALVSACSSTAGSTTQPSVSPDQSASGAPVQGSSAPSAKPDLGSIRVASGSQTSWQTYLTAIAPVKLGYFTDEGFSNVDWTFAGNDANSLAAVVAGQADFAVGVATDSVMKVAQQGERVYIIASISNKLTHMIFGAKGISSLGALKGQTVATDETAGTIDGYIGLALESAGLTLNDVTLVRAGGSSERYAALENGIVQAAVIGSSLIPRARSAGFVQLYDMTTLYDEYLQRVTIVNADYADAHPEAVDAFMRATVKAHAWLHDPANVDDLWTILSEHDPQIDKTDYEEALKLQLAALPPDALFTEKGFDVVHEEIKAEAPDATFDKLVRLDPAKKAVQELGIQP